MAKATAKPKATPGQPQKVVVTYDLFDLPSAFHKAGLAGLVLLLDSLKERRILSAKDVDYDLTPTSVKIAFSEVMLQKIMDELYDAATVEVSVKSKWAGADIKREETLEEEVDGKRVRSKRFIYDVVQAKGKFLRDLYPDEDGLWLKLWRDMLWSIPRGRPTTREPYKQRAEGEQCKEGNNAWNDLLKVEKARKNNGFHTTALSSALFPGAQAVNAEGVSFEGRAEQNLLLHFWPLTVLLFVPQMVQKDGTTEFVGFTVAVPEISNLADFVQDYPRLLSSLNEGLPPDKTARGYRPANSVVDLPAEGALAFLDHLAQLTGQLLQEGTLRFAINSVEYLHLVKEGNNVKTMSAGRVAAKKKLLRAYHEIVRPRDSAVRFRNPLFRRGLLVALLDERPWYVPFAQTLCSYDVDLFIRSQRNAGDERPSDKSPPHFANDAARKFRQDATQFSESQKRKATMPEPERLTAPASVIVNRVVRNYLLVRAAAKSNIALDKFASPEGEVDWKAVPSEFNEAKQKLAESLFFEFRSRKDRAFVDHFAATFFSVTQRIAEPDRLALAEALTSEDKLDDLKTLTLLSLSANS